MALVNIYPLDAAILVAYLILYLFKRDNRILLCLLPFIGYLFTFHIENTNHDIYAYSLYSGLYITLSYYFIKRRDFIIFVPIITMASYDLLFAYDSWANSTVETWIWRNHETIICILHAFVLLVFIEKFRSLVDACITYVNLLRPNRVSNNACTNHQERKRGEARNT